MDFAFPPTFVLRHKKENLKKCSLRGLEKRSDFQFFRYPMVDDEELPKSNYVILAIDGTPLSKEDSGKGLFLIDATWRYAKTMSSYVDSKISLEKRSIPGGFVTAYPRYQEDCPDPSAGLASIEALYIAYALLGRDASELFDGYYWKKNFLEKNTLLLKALTK